MSVRKCRLSAARIVLAIFGGLAVSWLSGCGGGTDSRRASVAGNVTVDGQPLPEANIAFIPTGKTAAPTSGGTIAGGAYSIKRAAGPMVGTYRVEIRAVRKTGKKIEAGAPSPPGTMIDDIEQYLPPRYNAQSTLTAEIKPGTNQIDFELRTKP